MKTISKIEDLAEYGIFYLTGEADNLMFRGLYDLTKQGAEIVTNCYGLKVDCFVDNWNPGHDDNPHVGSVMLTHNAWQDVGVFCLLLDCKKVIITDTILIGLQGTDDYKPVPYDWDNSCYLDEPAQIKHDGHWNNWLESWGKVIRVIAINTGHPNDGAGRNVHSFTGRIT